MRKIILYYRSRPIPRHPDDEYYDFEQKKWVKYKHKYFHSLKPKSEESEQQKPHNDFSYFSNQQK